MGTVPIDPGEHDYPAAGGGWISGPMVGGEDNRPEYSPTALVFEIVDVLAAAGITANPGPASVHLASIAAADLLRALGVKPATAPERRR